jgi:TonB family protein
MRNHVIGPALVIAITLQSSSADVFSPARLIEGTPPPSAAQTIVGGGEVLLEVIVAPEGQVDRIERLRVTPPYTDLVAGAVESWRFSPATRTSEKEGRRAIESRVLVAAVYRPPATYLGTTVGELPKDVAARSTSIPMPQQLIAPVFPPTMRADARGGATVVLEIAVGTDGAGRDIRVVHSGGGFDPAALEAAERWTFAPARLPEGPVPALAYVVMGFREPVVSGPR